MKLLNSVDYFGLLFAVPTWAKWIATDSDGEVYFYEFEPSFIVDEVSSWKVDYLGEYVYVGKVDLEGLDWRETLKAV